MSHILLTNFDVSRLSRSFMCRLLLYHHTSLLKTCYLSPWKHLVCLPDRNIKHFVNGHIQNWYIYKPAGFLRRMIQRVERDCIYRLSVGRKRTISWIRFNLTRLCTNGIQISVSPSSSLTTWLISTHQWSKTHFQHSHLRRSLLLTQPVDNTHEIENSTITAQYICSFRNRQSLLIMKMKFSYSENSSWKTSNKSPITAESSSTAAKSELAGRRCTSPSYEVPYLHEFLSLYSYVWCQNPDMWQ